jgi:hypothetical protein
MGVGMWVKAWKRNGDLTAKLEFNIEMSLLPAPAYCSVYTNLSSFPAQNLLQTFKLPSGTGTKVEHESETRMNILIYWIPQQIQILTF